MGRINRQIEFQADVKRYEVTDRNYNHLLYVDAVDEMAALIQASREFSWAGSASPSLRATEVGR